MNNLNLLDNIQNGFFSGFLSFITLIALFAGIMIITIKNPIVSVLHLILLFSSISVYLIFIGVTFIGISYLLVYVGAVSILFLFILMLINIRISELISDTKNNIPLAILVVLAFFIPIGNILPDSEYKGHNFNIEEFLTTRDLGGNIAYVSSNNWDNNIVDVTDISSIGNIMYTSHSVWLMVTSLILLLGMVGAIVITISQKD